MQTRRSILAATLACTASVVAPPLLSAQIGVQKERNAPDAYAITNARIVPVAGPTIERGNVIIRNGVIVAVGATAAVPADARSVDGSGLTVYPGLIDAYGSLGISSGAAGGGAQGSGRGGSGGGAPAQQGGPTSAPNSTQPPGLQPEVAAVDLIRPDDEAFSGPRSGGITAALTAPRSGIFIGQSAVINLAGLTPQEMLVKAPIALHVGFSPTRGGYPNSLMGVFAVLRQTLLDAQHYGEVQAAYAKNPRGMRRPEYDPSLAALQPVLNRQIPVVMAASTQREIERALDLAKEFNLRPIITGGSEAYKVADRLKAEGVPVLLSLNFPRRPAAASPDADPEPLRVLRDRVQAPKTSVQLAQTGVRFAFQSGGISTWSDVIGNASRAVESGLAPDAALRALTLTPAEILGVSDRLGTIEVGKIANLTITRGDIFDRNARVTQLFIDGKPIDVHAQTPAAGAAASAAAGAGSLANGSWTVTVTLDEGEKAVTLQINQQGDVLRGTLQGAMGSAQIQNATVTANGEVHFTSTVTIGSGTEEATFSGTINGNAIRGTVQIIGHPQGTFVGTRPDAANNGNAGGGRRGRPPQE